MYTASDKSTTLQSALIALMGSMNQQAGKSMHDWMQHQDAIHRLMGEFQPELAPVLGSELAQPYLYGLAPQERDPLYPMGIPIEVWDRVRDDLAKHTSRILCSKYYGRLPTETPTPGKFERGFNPPLLYPEGEGEVLFHTANLNYMATPDAIDKLEMYNLHPQTLEIAHRSGDRGCTPDRIWGMSKREYTKAQNAYRKDPDLFHLPDYFETWYKYRNETFIVTTDYRYKSLPPSLTITLGY